MSTASFPPSIHTMTARTTFENVRSTRLMSHFLILLRKRALKITHVFGPFSLDVLSAEIHELSLLICPTYQKTSKSDHVWTVPFPESAYRSIDVHGECPPSTICMTGLTSFPSSRPEIPKDQREKHPWNALAQETISQSSNVVLSVMKSV